MTDAQLIKKYLDGDMASFNTLIWRWEKPLYSFIYRFIGDPELAKDITQKTFIRVYKNLSTLKEYDKFKSWCYQIAANLCRDELKKLKKKSPLPLDCLTENDHNLVEDYQAQPDMKMNQQQLKEIIKKALKEIPEEQRIVIIMKEYQGLKFIEISEALGEPINTVKSRMYYGLNALRKVFERWNLNKEVLQYEM